MKHTKKEEEEIKRREREPTCISGRDSIFGADWVRGEGDRFKSKNGNVESDSAQNGQLQIFTGAYLRRAKKSFFQTRGSILAPGCGSDILKYLTQPR